MRSVTLVLSRKLEKNEREMKKKEINKTLEIIAEGQFANCCRGFALASRMLQSNQQNAAAEGTARSPGLSTSRAAFIFICKINNEKMYF